MILFWLRESFKLIGRAKSSFFLSLVSTGISVCLITASVITIQVSGNFQRILKRNVSINVFLSDSLSRSGTLQLQRTLKNKYYISSVEYIDKQQAAKNFIKETGEDFQKVLNYNPLPASFLIKLKANYVERDSLNRIVDLISRMSGVDDVVFQQAFVYKLLNVINRIKKYIFIITAILLLISLYIVYSTVKLITTTKYEELETMKLVGAKLSTIKMPIILNSFFTGLFAGIISLAIFSLVIYYFGNLIDLRRFLNFRNGLYILILLFTGPVIGIIISLFSLRKITLKI